MIQVENEIGMQGDTRDRSPVAKEAFAGPVPKELMDYLQQHKDTLIPEFRQVWEAAGFKTSGTWEEVFGKGAATDEIFMAWSFARYVGRVVEAGKAEYPIPMYVNARGVRICDRRSTRTPPSGGPHARPDGRLASRGAENRHALARHLRRRLRGDVRAVHPIREPAVHTRDAGISAEWRWPECSTPSDATMRSASRRWGSKGPAVPDIELTSATT